MSEEAILPAVIDDVEPSPNAADGDNIARAVAAFLAAGFRDGQPIPHDWFYNALDIEEPTATMPMEQAKPLQLRYMSSLERLKTALLTEHCIALKSLRSVGYAIVPPAEQPDWARRHLDKDLSEAFRAATARATFVRLDGLSNSERTEQMAVMANISAMRAHVGAARAAAKRRNIFGDTAAA